MVEIVVDTSSLRSRNPSGNVTGRICLSVGAEYFPDPQWNDFPIIILGWWIEGLLEVVHGRAKTFEGRFMDGPYFFLVEHMHGTSASITLHEPKDSRHQAIGLRALLVSAAAAGAQVAHASKVNGWSNADLTHLEALLAKAAA
jgi:hypothetical protein